MAGSGGLIVWAALWAAAMLFLAPCSGQAGFFLSETYDEKLTSGQLTVSPFDFRGESLGPKQTCLVSGASTDGTFPPLKLAPCASSVDTASLADKWAYNYTGNAFQSWGAGGSPPGPPMCLDAQTLESNLGSAYTKAYLRALPCDLNPLQKWVWNGTTIKLGGRNASGGSPDYWVAYKGETERFFALTPDASRAQSFSFVIPKDDASGTATYTPLPVQDYADFDIVPTPPLTNTGPCGDNPWLVNDTNPAQCTSLCDRNPLCVATSYQSYGGCCYLKSSLSGAPRNWFNINTRKAVYVKGSVYDAMLPTSSGSGGSKAGVIAAAVGGSLALLALLCLLVGYFLWKRRAIRRRARSIIVAGDKNGFDEHHFGWATPLESSKGGVQSSFEAASLGSSRLAPVRPDVLQEWQTFEYHELFEATKGFCNQAVLGKGACSTVYKGTLANGAEVAVKVIGGEALGSALQSDGSFEREVRTMGRIRHKNLVCLRGCVRQGATRVIVLDYAANGSLADALAGKGPALDWPTRLRVAEDAARGLNYLHNDIVPACLHRDIKPANILLDDQLNALVADFGLAKHIGSDVTHVETRMAGTFGFMAPECLMTGNATKAGDVFSFGGVLLVLITGRPMVMKQPDGSPKSLVQWIFDRTHLEDPGEYVDPSLGANYSADEAAFLLRLALGCISRAELRPPMALILRLLSELRGGRSPGELAEGLPPLRVEEPDTQYGASSSGGSGSYYQLSQGYRNSRSSGFSTEHSFGMHLPTALSDGR